MKSQNLEIFIRSNIPMSVEKSKILAEKFELIILPKNELLILEGKPTNNTYILDYGFIRSFTNDSQGNDVTTNIFSPYCFVNDVLAFFKKKPASENFQTITECTVWKMSYEDVQTNFHSIPEFREFGRMMLINNLSILKKRMLGMIQDTAEERYLKLMKQHPEILQHIPLKMIATYLGITDSSLSRIRKEIMQK